MGVTAQSVLGLKASAQRRAREATAMSLSKALRRGLSRAAEDLWGLGLAARLSSEDTLDQDGCLDRLAETDLLVVLDGPEGRTGLACFDAAFVTGLIEVQTFGKVASFPPEERRYTATDAAMMAPLLDHALPVFADLASSLPEGSQAAGYAFGAQVEDRLAASVMLNAPFYTVLTFDIDLANGTRHGRAVFVLPQSDADGVDTAGKQGAASGKYAESLKLVPARMQAVLTRIHLPLSRAATLKPGDVLDLSISALSTTSLVIEGGHVIARGKLGQMNGLRAVRLGNADRHAQAPCTEGEDGAKPQCSRKETDSPGPKPEPSHLVEALPVAAADPAEG